MFSVFLELVKRVGIFMIIGQTILHFGISRTYEKYIKLVVSFMIAAQIVFAFGAYLKKEDGALGIWSQQEYYAKWDDSMEKMTEALYQRQEELKEGLRVKIEEEKTKTVKKQEEGIDKIEIETIRIR